MKLKLQTATRTEERSTQKQPTQLNMVAARATKPTERPKSTPNRTSSSFFSLPRSECIWSSHLQERDFNLVRSARAALCVSRAPGNSARERPKHISKMRVNSSHTPFSFFHCCQEKRPDQHKGKKPRAPQTWERSVRAGGDWVRAADTNMSRSRFSPAAPLRLYSLTQPLLGLTGARCAARGASAHHQDRGTYATTSGPFPGISKINGKSKARKVGILRRQLVHSKIFL